MFWLLFFSIDFVRPICLPIFEPYINHKFVDISPFVVGFGRVGDPKTLAPISDKLKQVQVPIIENNKCKEYYERLGKGAVDTFDDRVLCAGGIRGEGTCVDDDGGPLMQPMRDNGTFAYYQIGIVSYAPVCGERNVPTIYTRIQHYADWIKEHVAK